MATQRLKRANGVKEKPESTILVSGVECKVHSEKFPDGKWRDVYRFTVPGWKECKITGLRATRRVINARLDPGVQFLYGINR